MSSERKGTKVEVNDEVNDAVKEEVRTNYTKFKTTNRMK
jgi:hypothetical protein